MPEKDDDGKVIGYTKGQISDGQFNNHINGLGRTIFNNGKYQIGWYKDSEKHGY